MQGLPFFMSYALKLLIVLTKNSLHSALGYTFFKKFLRSKNCSRHFFIHIESCIWFFLDANLESKWPSFAKWCQVEKIRLRYFYGGE